MFGSGISSTSAVNEFLVIAVNSFNHCHACHHRSATSSTLHVSQRSMNCADLRAFLIALGSEDDVLLLVVVADNLEEPVLSRADASHSTIENRGTVKINHCVHAR